jgi:Flp pilus assembly protein TadG
MKIGFTRWGRSGVRRLLGDSRGVTAIEFAMFAPFMVIMILGTIEVALNMFVDASVQLAAQAASRAGLTTSAPAVGTRAQQAQKIVTSILGGWSNIGATVNITELTYGTYNNIGNTNYQAVVGLGGFGDVVSYNISVTMPAGGFSGIPKILGIPPMVFQRNYLVQNEQ